MPWLLSYTIWAAETMAITPVRLTQVCLFFYRSAHKVSGKWFYLNADEVRTTLLSTEEARSTAYLLFYRQRPWWQNYVSETYQSALFRLLNVANVNIFNQKVHLSGELCGNYTGGSTKGNIDMKQRGPVVRLRYFPFENLIFWQIFWAIWEIYT